MSASHSPAQASRKPVGQVEEQPQSGTWADGTRHTFQRKKLPPIPMPTSGRLQGGPVSPVRINVANDPWFPSPSSAQIEDATSSTFGSEHAEETVTGKTRLVENALGVSSDGRRSDYKQDTQRLPLAQNQVRLVESPTVHQSRELSPLQPLLPNPDESTFMIDFQEMHVSEPEVVPQLQYYHQDLLPRPSSAPKHNPGRSSPGSRQPHGQDVSRSHTPTMQPDRRTTVPRPASAFSALSDFGPRGPSPARGSSPNWQGGRAASANSGRSPDGQNRFSTYADMLQTSYPQRAPTPITFDNSHLRAAVGSNASLLSTQKTLEMYRQNVKKTTEPEIQYRFALLLIDAAHEAGFLQDDRAASPVRKVSPQPGRESPYPDETSFTPQSLLREARQILSRLADRSYPFAQYYLADGYSSGLFNKGRGDYDRAFPLFVAASKHGHAESGYRAALCYEFGWGCRKDLQKAVQFFRQSASKNHPGAMTRLGRACLSGELGLNKYREGLKWLNRATESADHQYNSAPYHLGLLYESGYGDDVFQDETYAAQLFTQAADLGHVEANYRMGGAYEYGRLSCPKDPALSVHFYNCAAQQGHPAAMMALCAWYMIGAEPILQKDENEAYEWALQSANCGLTKAEYAVGFFTESGIGCRRDPLEANRWYVRAAEAGDERAKHRLRAIQRAISGGDPMEVAQARSADLVPNGRKKKMLGSKSSGESKDEKECVMM